MDHPRALELIQERQEALQRMDDHAARIDALKKYIELVTADIRTKCDHDWGPFYYQKYEKPSRTCNICGSCMTR